MSVQNYINSFTSFLFNEEEEEEKNVMDNIDKKNVFISKQVSYIKSEEIRIFY